MRIRSVKPEFWRDAELAIVADATRLFFVGLWQEADDTGWLRWELREIAADLYPYRGVKSRERDVERHALALLEIPGAPFIVAECGRHALIPGLSKHQLSAGGKKSAHVQSEHFERCWTVDKPVDTVENGEVRTDTARYGRKGRGGKGKEGEVSIRARGANGGSIDAARAAIAAHESGESPLAPAVEAAMRSTIARHEGSTR